MHKSKWRAERAKADKTQIRDTMELWIDAKA